VGSAGGSEVRATAAKLEKHNIPVGDHRLDVGLFASNASRKPFQAAGVASLSARPDTGTQLSIFCLGLHQPIQIVRDPGVRGSLDDPLRVRYPRRPPIPSILKSRRRSAFSCDWFGWH
jgi:hypothetical protein